MLYNPITKQGDRVGIRYLEESGGSAKCATSNPTARWLTSEAAASVWQDCNSNIESTIVPALTERFGYSESHAGAADHQDHAQHGRGRGAARTARSWITPCSDLTRISGQKPLVRNARKSVATFKIREGFPVGAKVTLRRDRMYEFIDRLVSVAIPRIRDFRGLNPRSFDGRGNYSMGLREQIVFPEVDYDTVRRAARPGHHHHHHRAYRSGGARAAGRFQFSVPQVSC